ncbi:MAG: hypothetical protein Q9219_007610 [cf. Caloplaca sp. 3 TL-2023]
MSALSSVDANLDPITTEDPMELYPDPSDRPIADDSIDIDLDLTSDPPESHDDDEMVEDLEIEMEEDAADSDIDTAYDEQMADEAAGIDAGSHEHIEDTIPDQVEDLDDLGSADSSDPIHKSIGIPGQLPPLDYSDIDIGYQEVVKHETPQESELSIQSPNEHHSELPGLFVDNTQEHIKQTETDEEPGFGDQVTVSVKKGSNSHHPDDHSLFNQNQVEEFVHKAQSPATDNAFSPQKPPIDRGLVQYPQIIERKTSSDRNQSTISSRGSSIVVNDIIENHETVGNTEANLSFGTPVQDLHGQQNHPGLQRDGANESSSHGYHSPARLIRQDSANVPSDEAAGESGQNPLSSAPSGINHFPDTVTPQENPHIHPIVVLYEESEMFLFPPATDEQDNAQTYFLTDETLAVEPIQNLLKECRIILEGNIDEQEELEIYIDVLELRISEVSRFSLFGPGVSLTHLQSSVDATSTTLNQILDIYLQLYYHDGIDSPPPMSLSLTTKARFSHRFEYLSNLIAEGKGISRLEEEDTSVHITGSETAEDSWNHETGGKSPGTSGRNRVNKYPIEKARSQDDRLDRSTMAEKSMKDPLDDQQSLGSSSNQISSTDNTATDTFTGAASNNAPSHIKLSPVPHPAQNRDELATQLPQLSDDTERNIKHENEEDDIDYEVADDASEDTSPSSSTIQGDVLHTVEGLDDLEEEKTHSSEMVSAQKSAVPNYHKASENNSCPISGFDESVPSNIGFTLSKPSADKGLDDQEDVPPQAAASSYAEDASSHSDPKEQAVMDKTSTEKLLDACGHETEKSRFSHDCIGQDQKGGPKKGQAPDKAWNSANNHDSTPTLSPSRRVCQNLDQGKCSLDTHSSSDTVTRPEKDTPLSREQSAKVGDEDEITFDDEINDELEEGVASKDAPTDHDIDQTTTWSPGSLKRARTHDDVSDMNCIEGTIIPKIYHKGV